MTVKAHTTWATGVRFLREQDGSEEQKLKARLSGHFRETGRVERAYLAYVEFEPESLGTGVALCLCGNKIDTSLFEPIYKIFGEMFAAQESLNVLLIDARRESELANICEPFFTSVGCFGDRR